VDEEATGHARQAINVQVAAIMLHFGKGGPDAVRMATLLGIPLAADWGHNTFPHVARHYGKNTEILALHACDINLATEIKMATEAGVKVEPVGGTAQRFKELETKFRAAFTPMCDETSSPIAVAEATYKAASEVGGVLASPYLSTWDGQNAHRGEGMTVVKGFIRQ